VKSVKYITSLLFFALTALLVAACGGGGGGGGDDGVPTAPSTPVSITGANAELISADVLYSAELLGGFSLVGDLLPSVQVDATSSKFNLPDFIFQQLQHLQGLSLSSSEVSINGAAIIPVTEDCAYGGTVNYTGDVEVGSNNFPESWIPTEGDQITMTFNVCDELGGVELDGTISIAITTLDDTGDPDIMELQVVLTELSVSLGGDDLNFDGDMQMILSAFESGDKQLYLGGEEFTVWAGSEVETLKNYAYDYFEEYTGTGSNNYSYQMNGTLNSTVINGSVSFFMTAPLVEFQGDGIPFDVYPDNYPFAGDLSITGADTSNLKISVNSIDNIMIELYFGDMPDGNIMTDWLHLDECLSDPGVCFPPM